MILNKTITVLNSSSTHIVRTEIKSTNEEIIIGKKKWRLNVFLKFMVYENEKNVEIPEKH